MPAWPASGSHHDRLARGTDWDKHCHRQLQATAVTNDNCVSVNDISYSDHCVDSADDISFIVT